MFINYAMEMKTYHAEKRKGLKLNVRRQKKNTKRKRIGNIEIIHDKIQMKKKLKKTEDTHAYMRDSHLKKWLTHSRRPFLKTN